jgi:hypothetical protein
MSALVTTRRRFFSGAAVMLACLLAVTTTWRAGGEPSASAAIVFVDVQARGANDGSSWADAYHDLQVALKAAGNPAEIWVAQGMYRATPGSDRTASFVLKTGVAIYGGFIGDETARDQRDPEANATILSGDTGFAYATVDNAYHVVRAGNVGQSAVLDGFTISGGNADGDAPAELRGGGMHIAGGSPTLANLVFTANSALYGGGLFVNSGSPSLSEVVFRGNVALDRGGGMYNGAGAPAMQRVSFVLNSATWGGGILNDAGSPTIVDTLFQGNTAEGHGGGGMANVAGDPALRRVAFISNHAQTSSGGGLSNGNGGPSVVNATFSGNTAAGGAGLANDSGTPGISFATFSGNRGGSVISNDTGRPRIAESILWGNSGALAQDIAGGNVPEFGHNLLEGGCPAGVTCNPAGVIVADPRLGRLRNNGGATKTHALPAGSPAIDAATAAVCTANATDQRGVARPLDGERTALPPATSGRTSSRPPHPWLRSRKAHLRSPKACRRSRCRCACRPPPWWRSPCAIA